MNVIVWFVAGGVAWALALAVKAVVSGGLHTLTDTRLSGPGYAALQGAASASCELGFAGAAFALVLPRGSAALVVAFGVGAGALEAVLLLAAARAEERAAQRTREDPPPVRGLRRHGFVVERTAATLGHVGARGLVWLGVHGSPWPWVLALVTFAAVDGTATFGVRRGWDWTAPAVWWRFNAFIVAVGILEVAVFVLLASGGG
jgi:hypothetical protein